MEFLPIETVQGNSSTSKKRTLLCRYTRENHNSVLGMREYALQHDARFQAVEEEWVEEWISGHKEDDHFVHPVAGTEYDPTYSLFAFPAEENFAGKKYPLRWIREIQVCAFSVCIDRLRSISLSSATMWGPLCLDISFALTVPWLLGELQGLLALV